tara:strand:- start:423 stop:878 length:456 start_codon:yes stop_codon:yes gene_type:complete
MIKKSHLFIIILIFLHHCGYTPIYKGLVNANFAIVIKEIRGDRDLGNSIKSNLNRYRITDGKKLFYVSASSNYLKNSISKDTTGKTTEYQLKAVTVFKIEKENIIKEIKITESFNMKSKNNKFEENEYELILKESMANTIVQKLILQLNRL